VKEKERGVKKRKTRFKKEDFCPQKQRRKRRKKGREACLSIFLLVASWCSCVRGGKWGFGCCCFGPVTMIRAIVVMNNTGKPRVVKFYERRAEDEQQLFIAEIFELLSKRTDGMCNFLEGGRLWGRDTKIIYRQYATLFFVWVVDSSESELGILDLIQTFVVSLDKCFRNVCELDIVFNCAKVRTHAHSVFFYFGDVFIFIGLVDFLCLRCLFFCFLFVLAAKPGDASCLFRACRCTTCSTKWWKGG
jgi:Clathrin adaptor complex small chain